MKSIIIITTLGFAFTQLLNAQQPQTETIDKYKNTREGNNSFKKEILMPQRKNIMLQQKVMQIKMQLILI